MRLIGLGIAVLMLAGIPSALPAQDMSAAQPAPPAPYRRCSSGGRGVASIGTCALRISPGGAPILQIRLERALTARPAAVVLFWSERDNGSALTHRIEGLPFAEAGTAAGTILSIPIPNRYCKPNARRFSVELELADGRNLGAIGHFTFPCSR